MFFMFVCAFTGSLYIITPDLVSAITFCLLLSIDCKFQPVTYNVLTTKVSLLICTKYKLISL